MWWQCQKRELNIANGNTVLYKLQSLRQPNLSNCPRCYAAGVSPQKKKFPWLLKPREAMEVAAAWASSTSTVLLQAAGREHLPRGHSLPWQSGALVLNNIFLEEPWDFGIHFLTCLQILCDALGMSDLLHLPFLRVVSFSISSVPSAATGKCRSNLKHFALPVYS